MEKIKIFTDGGCRGNPGDGGWGAIIWLDDSIVEMSGNAKMVTNNQNGADGCH